MLAGTAQSRIVLPADMAEAAEKLPVRGMKGKDKGTFTVGSAQGTFFRKSDLEYSRDLRQVTGKNGFTFAAAETGGVIAAQCGFREEELDFALTEKPRRLHYECAFTRDGKPIEARLTLSNPEPAKDRRAGQLDFEGQSIAIHSVHQLAGAKVPTRYPLGYLFETGGRAIGGVDLSDTSRPDLFAPREAGLRKAILVAGLALSTFGDPAQDIDREEGLIVGQADR